VKQSFFAVAAVFWMGLIFLLSSVPGRYLGPDTVMNLLTQKFGHFSLYGVLSVLLFFASGADMRTRRAWRIVFVVVFLTALYAVSDEYHQSFISGRHSSAKDVVIDVSGAVAFLSFLYFWKNRKSSVGRGGETDSGG
jgi:VanZ family protein